MKRLPFHCIEAPSVPTPPPGTPAGYVPTTGADGSVAWAEPESGTTPPPETPPARWEVLMASGVTPPEPLTSSDGFDWLYGEASS